MPRIAKTALVTLFLASFGIRAEATTYSMVYDGDLHDQAVLVARVEVLTTSPAPGFGAPHTDNIVLVERLLKGRVSGTTIVVRVLGGVGPDGLGLEIHGAPRLSAGDRALLFLKPRGDGTYGVLHLMLGAFFESGTSDRRVAMRQFEGREFGAPGEHQHARDWDRFETWLADRSIGVFREPDYLTELTGAPGSFRLPAISKVESKPTRFFEFDAGDKVFWQVGGGVFNAGKAFRRAVKVWNRDPATVVLLKQKGQTPNTNGFTAPDGANSIIFGDPNREIDGSYDCVSGGVIALGGSWFFPNSAMAQTVPKDKGKGKANVALEADIIVNDGANCLLEGSVKAAEQVFGHELGHTLGLKHSCDDDGSGPCDTEAKSEALMRAFFHEDGRGAVLGVWDRKRLDRLY